MKADIDKIIIELAKKKWSVSHLAKAYGVSRSRMHIILNSRNLTPACVGRLADALGVDVDEIIKN